MRTAIGPAGPGIVLLAISASGSSGGGKRPASIIARNVTAFSSDQGGSGICAIMSIKAFAFGSSGITKRFLCDVLSWAGSPVRPRRGKVDSPGGFGVCRKSLAHDQYL